MSSPFTSCAVSSPAQSSASTTAWRRLALGVSVGLLSLGGVAHANAPVGAAAGSVTGSTANAAACPALLQRTVPRLQDEKPQDLCQFKGQVTLVVNTASFCGYTSQYKGLEALYSQYRARGLVVLGFPSNDFSQEPGGNKQIAEFCESTFGVKFPMFAKTTITGTKADPLFAELARRTGVKPGWNFHKYLISRDGQTVTSYASNVDPQDRSLVRDIEKLLQSPK
jgi:glutathione peroxidase